MPSDTRSTAKVLKLSRARRWSQNGEGRLRRLRAGLPLRPVAQAIGVSTTTVYRWEMGQHVPTGDAAVAWVDLLDELEAS